MQQNKPESSGLSSKLRVKPNNTQPVDDGDPNQKKYIFYLDVTIPDVIDVPKTDVIVSTTMKVSEAVSLALMKFKLELETLGVIVDTNRDLYNPRLPKRTGKAKTDMPSLDDDQILSQIKISGVSLQMKSQKAVVLAGPPAPPAVVAPVSVKEPEPPVIKQEIGLQKKEVKEIVNEVNDKPQKPESGCFFSFC